MSPTPVERTRDIAGPTGHGYRAEKWINALPTPSP